MVILHLNMVYYKGNHFNYNVKMGQLRPKRWVYYPGHSYKIILCYKHQHTLALLFTVAHSRILHL
jgi:hypothetical protein